MKKKDSPEDPISLIDSVLVDDTVPKPKNGVTISEYAMAKGIGVDTARGILERGFQSGKLKKVKVKERDRAGRSTTVSCYTLK